MKLRNRIALTAVVLVNITGAAVGGIAYYQLNDTLRKQDREWSASLAQAVAKAVTRETLARDKVGVRNILRGVEKSNSAISYLLVVDFDDRLFASTFAGPVPAPLTRGLGEAPLGEEQYIDIEGVRVKDVSYPLIDGLNAHLHIGINEAIADATLTRASLVMMAGALLITLLGVLAAFLVSRRISQPLTQLGRALHTYGRSGHIGELPQTTASDRELRELYQSFHTMVEQRARSERNLDQRTAQLNSVVSASPVVLFACDRNGVFTLSEGAALGQLGFKPGQVVGQSLFQVYAEFPDISAAARRVLQGEALSTTAQVAGRVFEIHWSPTLDPQGHADGIIAVAVDVTELKRAESQLRELNAQLERRVEERTAEVSAQAAVLDQIHDAVITTDLQGVVSGWNRGAVRLCGYGAEEAIGRHISRFYPEDQQEVLQAQVIAPLLAQGAHETEVVMLRQGGQPFDAHLSLTLLRNAAGEPQAMVGYALDISDRKQAERRLQVAMDQANEASRAKTEFLSRMSHELRTPMNAILGFGQLLEANIDGTMSALDLEYVGEVMKGGRHLLDLINEVLDLARVESGKMQLSMETVELCGLVRECVALLRPLAEQRGIVMQVTSLDQTVLVHADRMRLKQSILNLLSNAVKYNRDRGSVVIRCERHGERHRLSVTDTGPGIPQAMQHRVFSSFDRLGADTSNIEGTGIGLALAKRIVEFMQGGMGFSSVEGEGCTFWIDLQSGDGQVNLESVGAATTRSGQAAVGEHTVLYVEDNPANLRLVQGLLNKRGGVTLYDAHTVNLALDLIRSHRFDLILLDIHLAGEEDGYDLLHALRAEPATRSIPVVAISATATAHDIERGLAAGFHDYLTKPIDIAHFYQVLNYHLDGKQG